MKRIDTHLEGCFIIEPKIFYDERGFFYESYNHKNFLELYDGDIEFIQDNLAKSTKNVVRGLHLQKPPYGQSKLVSCIKGKVLDVAVDVRKNSKTYGQHVCVELSEENKKQLFIPKGFLHGYAVLTDEAIFAYKCDEFYHKEAELGVKPYDTELKIDWKIVKAQAIISEKDMKAQNFQDIKAIE